MFRGLDIGTAKATAADRARVPHHGLDLVDPDQPFSVADFAAHARAVLDELGGRGGVAILAGGTGLYLRAVARGLDTDAAAERPGRCGPAWRRTSTPTASSALVARLEALAPRRIATIDLRNPRRVVRALEIAELQGDGRCPPPRGYPGRSPGSACSSRPAEHRDRIAARARAQFDAGLVEEARALRERFDPALPAFSAIGYREAWAVLDGELTPRRRDRARRPAQHPVRQAPGDMVPARARDHLARRLGGCRHDRGAIAGA